MSLFSILAVALLGPAIVAIAVLAVVRFAPSRSLGGEIFAWRLTLVSFVVLPLASVTLPSIDTGDAFPFVTPSSLGLSVDDDETLTSDLAIGIYVAGLAVVWAAVATIRLRKQLRTVAARALLSTNSAPLEVRMGSRGPVIIASSALITSPATLGTWVPRILLPAVAAGWPASRRAAAIAHEMAHVDQRDDLWNRVAAFAVALCWFNPLAWIARARHAELVELAADARAASSFGDAIGYAEELLAIRMESSQASALCPGMTSTRLGRRVDALLGSSPDLEMRGTTRAAMLLLALGIGAGVALTGPARVPNRDGGPPTVVPTFPENAPLSYELKQHRIRDSARERVRALGRSQRNH